MFQEAGSLQNILALAERLPGPSQAKVNQAVKIYVEMVVCVQWPMLAVRQNSPAAAEGLNALVMLRSSDEIASILASSVHSVVAPSRAGP